MARVLLVQPPHRDTFGYSMPPVGLLRLASAAREAGHVVAILDLALLVRRGEIDPGPDGEDLVPACVAWLLGPQRWSDEVAGDERSSAASSPSPSLRSLRPAFAPLGTLAGCDVDAAPLPDVIGIGAMVSSMPVTLHLVEALKRRAPEVAVILGGQGPETVEEAILERHPAVDAVAVGEAELTLVAWLAALETGAVLDVPGLVVRHDGRPHRTAHRDVVPDLDSLPSPAWDLVESPAAYAEAAGSAEGLVPIDLGRGCTYHCSFCTTPIFWQRRARHLSPERAADELDRIAALPGVHCAYVTHDLFTGNRERVLAICAEKRRRGNTLAFECRTRLDLVDPELLSALKQAGCRRILYGVESDTPAILEHIAKGGRQQQGLDVRSALAQAGRSGVASIVGTMCGVPGEDAADVEANLQLMVDAALVDGTSLSLHWFNVLPGNGRAEELGDALGLVPGLTADLVRGFDVPAGRVAQRQLELMRDDPEIFAAFRVAPSGHATVTQLFLLTRHAHLLLEALPRSARALAQVLGRTLLQTFHEFLAEACGEPGQGSWPEPRLMSREETLERFVTFAEERLGSGDRDAVENKRGSGDRDATEDKLDSSDRDTAEDRLDAFALDPAAAGRARALLHYEHALVTTTGTALRRFTVDPLPLVRAAERGEPLPPVPPSPRAVLFVRRGERVSAHALSEFLADVAETGDDTSLVRRWPSVHVDDVLKARDLLTDLGLIATPLTPARTTGLSSGPST